MTTMLLICIFILASALGYGIGYMQCYKELSKIFRKSLDDLYSEVYKKC